MSKKLSFVYDKKSGDLLAPHFVPNHIVAVREYDSMKSNADMVFNKYPEDFLLITCNDVVCNCNDNGDFYFYSVEIRDDFSITPFVDIVGSDKDGN